MNDGDTATADTATAADDDGVYYPLWFTDEDRSQIARATVGRISLGDAEP